MMSTIFAHGRRLFTTAAIATLLLAVLHLFGTSRPVPPEIDGIAQAMQNTALDMGFGMSPSMWDTHQAIAYTMGITLAMLGVLALALAATTDVSAKVLTRTAAVMTTGCIVLVALYWVFRLPPPTILFAILTLLWGVAQRTTRLA